MSDFIKLFRRQRSFKQNVDNGQNCVPSQTDNNKLFERNDSTLSCQNNFSVTEEQNNQESFSLKQNKGWRKSFRKLKNKKRSPAMSVSYDNLAKMHANTSEKMSEVIKSEEELTISKRWSYANDLQEENVPGARELRGSLERKSSINHVADKLNYNAQYKLFDVHQAELNQNSSFTDCNVSANYCEPSYSNATQQLHQSSDFISQNTNPAFLNQSNMHRWSNLETHSWPRSYQLLDSDPLKKNYTCNQVELMLQQQKLEQDDFLQLSSEHDTAYTSTASASQQTLSLLQPSTSGLSLSFDGENIYRNVDDHFGVASNSPNAMALNTLHGQQDFLRCDDFNPDIESRIRTLTSSLIRGRVMTKYERDAEFALEKLSPSGYGEFDDRFQTALIGEEGYIPYSPFCRAVENQYEDIPFQPSDNTIHEFDSSSDELYEQFTSAKDKKEGLDKGKEVPKKRFWDRSSLKKRISASKTPTSQNCKSASELQISQIKGASFQLSQPPPPHLSENQLKRRRIVGTILSSEQSYIESLVRLEMDYKKPLLENRSLNIGIDIIEKMFYKIGDILDCHNLFWMTLSTAARNWDKEESIGEAFVASFSKGMVLECYGDFISNFATAMECVRKSYLRKQSFRSFLHEKQAESNDRLSLYGLMLKPVQRFPQFILLVQDLLKHTPTDHSDRVQLQLALTELETLANRLNRRKALDEDSADLRSLIAASNTKLNSQTKDGRLRRLIKQGDIREYELNDEGLMEKMKECLLVLTNDSLLCFAISNRKPNQRVSGSTSKDMYKLKWKVNLADIEVSDGPVKSYDSIEREKLSSDFVKLQEINSLVNELHFPHDNLTSQVVEQCIQDIQTRVRQAEQEQRQPEETSFSVKFQVKSEKASRALVTQYTSQKDEWLDEISKAKLGNASSNRDSWFISDGYDEDLVWDTPLFIRSFSAHVTDETLQVQCAYPYMPEPHKTVLWLACTCSTVLALVSVYCITENNVDKVHTMQVESSVQCMEHWNPFGDLSSVWLGMESGCLLEYSANGSYQKMNEVTLPTMSTVMIMRSHSNNLYVGLLDGTLAMYTRQKGSIGLDYVTSIEVGSGPMVCLAPEGGKLWGCSGNNVVTINLETFTSDSSRSLLMDGEEMVVNLVILVGRGLWLTFTHEFSLYLYHLDSLTRLQQINLSRVIKEFVQSLDPEESISENCSITSLSSAHSQLFVGTSSGILMSMPLTKLPDSVPKITGPCMICRHALSGPLTHLFSPEFPSRRDAAEQFTSSEDEAPPIPHRDDLDSTLVSTAYDDRAEFDKSLTTPVIPPDNQRSSLPQNYRVPLASPWKRFSEGVKEKFETPRQMSEEGIKDSLVENMKLHMIESHPDVTFVNWNKKSPDFPTLIACGEGYRRLGGTQNSHQGTDHSSPTIVCWKVCV